MTQAGDRAVQGDLGGDFDELWVRFEGQKVTKVILNFAGEVEVTDQVTAAALGYLEEVQFTITGRITGKKHSYVKGLTRGQAIVEVHEVALGDHVFDTKAAKRLQAEVEAAQDVTAQADADEITKARRSRARKEKDPIWDELDAKAQADQDAAEGSP